jgi:hypothetical protein
MGTVILTCIQCEEDFEFSIYEQEKYKHKGFDVPLRCPQCRKNKVKRTVLVEKGKIKDKKKHYRLKSEGYFDL